MNIQVIKALRAAGYRVTIKTFRGNETIGYNCTLKKNDEKVAFVVDDGNGGEPNDTWLDEAARAEVKALCAAQPGIQLSEDLVVPYAIENVVSDLEAEQKLREKIKDGHAVFITADGKAMTTAHPPTPQFVASTKAKLGAGTVEFLEGMGEPSPSEAEIGAMIEKAAEKLTKRGKTVVVRAGIFCTLNMPSTPSTWEIVHAKYPGAKIFAPNPAMATV